MIRPARCARAVGRIAVVLALHALWATPSVARPRGPLADSLATLAGESLSQASVGVLAISLERGDTLLAWRESDRLVPGSNAKLFTTGAFLKRFGPGSRWETKLLARGSASVKDGGRRVRFKGDLVLRGSGTPDVTALLHPGSRGLVDSLAARLRMEGLERFEGTLWVDGSIFARDPYPEGWAHEDLVYSYSAPVNGVLANGNAVLLTATGSEKGVAVSLTPPESPLTIRGGVSLGASGSAPRLSVHREPGSTVLDVAGSVPSGGLARQSVAVTDPDSTAGLLLLGAMKRAGIETKAVVRVLPERVEDAEKKRKDVESLLASVAATGGAVAPWSAARKDRSIVALALASPTAAEIVSMVNTFSLNTEAEALLRMLDPAPRGKRAERGIAELSRLLSEAGIDTADVLFSDGSGLSRMDLATARAVVAWLAALDRDPALGSLFREGLSTPGGSGTLANRLPDLEPGVSFRGKTGTLRNVSALSGYVTASGGERFAFTLIANGTRGSVAPARAAQDELVRVLGRARREATPPTGRPWGMPR